jgi:hypothetical protein
MPYKFIEPLLEYFSYRMPNVGDADLELDKIRKFLSPKILSISNKCDNPIKELFKIMGIEFSWALYRIVFNEPKKIFRIPILSQYFKDINNLRKVIGRKAFGEVSIRDWNLVKRNEYRDEEPFIEYMLERTTETILANKIDKNSDHLRDTLEMFDKVTKYKSEKGIDLLAEEELKGSLKDIHDTLSYLCDTMDNPNKELLQNYPENKYELECRLYDYHIKFANDTNELRSAGRQMKICVGTNYSDKASRRDCHIVFLMKGSKYVVCMELDPEMETVRQAKVFDNQKPEGEVEEVICQWIEMYGLSVRTHDLPRLNNMVSGRKRPTRVPNLRGLDNQIVEAM